MIALRVDEDVRVAAAAGRFGIGPTDEADRLGREEEVRAFGDRQADHPETEEHRHADRQPRPEGWAEGRQRRTQEEPHQEAEEKPDDGGHELGGGHLLDAAAGRAWPARP